MSEEQKVSDTMSVRNETILIEKYGMRMSLRQTLEKRPQWETRYVLENGERLTPQQAQALKNSAQVDEGTIAKVEWEECPAEWVGATPVSARLYDTETFEEGAEVWFFGTSHGPIIGTLCPHTVPRDWLKLYDPAHVQHTAQGQINLLPIFGVARTMELHVSSIKQRVPLNAIMAEVYLQFVMQNRQFKYELRPAKPMATSQPLENNEEAPSVATA